MEVRTTASSPTARSLIPVSATGDADGSGAAEPQQRAAAGERAF